MANQPSRLTKFWNELKRRKVVKVTIIYASTTFILLQLVDILIEPLHLPAWVMTFFVVLLVVGFPIAVIFSWIFDVTPDGLKVTQPVSRNKEKVHTETVSKKKTYLTNGFIGVLLIVVAILVYPKLFKSNNRGNLNPELEKSIAVLPFIDDSPEEGNSYIINGLMEEILNKLEKVQELNVKSRTAVEKYRGSKTDFSDIAKELNVNYILEGSGQKVGGRIKLMLQLIEAGSGNHLWSSPYIKEVNDENIFELQENVALSVVSELKAIITPKEKEQVIKKPTENLAAYNLYLKGLEYLSLYSNNTSYGSKLTTLNLRNAKHFFQQALNLDSAFADAYVKLAFIYIENLYFGKNTDLSANYLDSGLTMINKALLYDDEISFAYNLKGKYYLKKGMISEAKKAFDKSDQLSTKEEKWEKYLRSFWIFNEYGDFYNTLENFYKYLDTKPEEEKINLNVLHYVCIIYSQSGYPDMVEKYAKEILIHDNDSSQYFRRLTEAKNNAGNFESTFKYGIKYFRSDSTNAIMFYNLGKCFMCQKDLSEVIIYLAKGEPILKNSDTELRFVKELGYYYLLNGQKEEADLLFQVAIKNCQKEIDLNFPVARNYETHFNLACIYSSLNQKGKAMKYLRMLKNRENNSAEHFVQLKYNRMLDNIRNEPEFAEILADVEAKYQKEHERIEELLREHGEIE